MPSCWIRPLLRQLHTGKPGDPSHCLKRRALLQGPAPRLCCRLLASIAGCGLTESSCTAGASSTQQDKSHHRIHMCMLEVAAQNCWAGPSQEAAAVLGHLSKVVL